MGSNSMTWHKDKKHKKVHEPSGVSFSWTWRIIYIMHFPILLLFFHPLPLTGSWSTCLFTLCNHCHWRYLSKSAYGGKQAALNHLFCLHNTFRFPMSFKNKLLNLFCGFFCTIVQHHIQANCHMSQAGAPVGVGPLWNALDGKC